MRGWGDSWVLMAVAKSTTSDLADILFMADAINKAILSVEEIEHAVHKLVPAGLLSVSEDRFGITPQGQALIDEALGATPSVYEALDWLEDRFAELPEPEDRSWKLDPGVHSDAWRRYREKFREIFERLQEEKRRGTGPWGPQPDATPD